MFKKILLSFLVANFLFLSVFAAPAKAQSTSTWYQQTFFEWYDKVYDSSNQDEIFGERYTGAQVEWVLYGTFSFIINHIGSRNLNWCVIHLYQTGLTGGIGSFLVNLATTCPEAVADLNALFQWAGFGTGVFGADTSPLPYASTVPAKQAPQPPSSNYNLFPPNSISFVGYIKGIGTKLNIIPETQAQGFGATRALTGIEDLWRFVRDITYFVLIIGIIVLAFMIMFRVKLSPQTVVTLQSAIPRVIITLLLITFSYAIAGFMIDLMYVVLGLLAALFTSGGGISLWDWTRMFQAFTVDNTLGILFIYVIFFFVAVIWSFISYLGPLSLFFGVFLAIFAAIVLLIVMFILSLRIIWMLIRNFVEILLLVAFSPLFIVGGVVGVLGFGAWARQMVARLAVYPVVAVLLVFTFYFLGTAFGGVGLDRMPFHPTNVITAGDSWNPPLTLGSGAVELMFVFVSVVTLSLIPRAADIVRGAFSGRPFAMGTAIGEAMAVPMNLGQQARGAWTAGGVASFQQRVQSGTGTLGRVGSRLGVTKGSGHPAREARFDAMMERLKRT